MRVIVAILGMFLMAGWCATETAQVVHRVDESAINSLSPAACDIESGINDLSSKSQARIQSGLSGLRKRAKQSPTCRSQIIAALMKAMDKPNLDFTHDASSYYVWLYGADLLGDLKAVTALDLLISHLDLIGPFFSTSMNHQPALRGVIKMGEVAIPKLEDVLKRSSRPTMRHAAVYCIASIGGPEAVRSLKDAVSTESNECVNRFMRVSLNSFDAHGHIKNRLTWFSGAACNE